MDSCVFSCFKVSYVKFDIVVFAELTDKILVAQTLLATQLEIAMDSLDTIAQLPERQQECHAVGSAADGYQV